MKKLDPEGVFARLRTDFPAAVQKDVVVVGSLAAAYHFRADLVSRAVNTKDADLVIKPAGNTRSCKRIAEDLFRHGWTRREGSFPQTARTPAGTDRQHAGSFAPWHRVRRPCPPPLRTTGYNGRLDAICSVM